MKAIILSAGLGTRLNDLTKSTPKCLVNINGIPLLQHQLNILKGHGITDITIVIGNEGDCWTKENQDKIKYLNPNTIINFDNTKTNNTYSLKLAIDSLPEDDLLILDGDLAFPPTLLTKILENNNNLILLKETEKEDDPSNKVILNENGKVLELNRNLKSKIIYGGLMKFNRENFALLRELLNKDKYYALDSGFLLEEFSQSNSLFGLIDPNWVNVNTATELNEAFTLLEKQFVILTYGYTAVGKSTIAKKISQLPNTEIFHSAVTRKEINLSPQTVEEADKFFDYRNNLRQAVDKKVYNLLAEKAEASLSKGKNVVLDAGFFFSWQRELVYEKTKKFNPEIFILKVSCSDEEEIKRRLQIRAEKFHDDPLNETPSWNTYLATKLVTEKIEKDKVPKEIQIKIIELDSLNNSIRLSDNSSNSKKIVKVMS